MSRSIWIAIISAGIALALLVLAAIAGRSRGRDSAVLRRTIDVLFFAACAAVAGTLLLATTTAFVLAIDKPSLSRVVLASVATMLCATLARLYVVQAKRAWRSLHSRRSTPQVE